METDRSTDGARENVGLGQRGAVTYSGRLRSSRLILIAAAITVVALSLFVWQQSTSMRPALAGGLGDADRGGDYSANRCKCRHRRRRSWRQDLRHTRTV